MQQPRGRGRYEPKYEDYRGSPYEQHYDRQRDPSPQRNMYDRSIDPRGNPHSDGIDAFQEKPFDYRYSNRYHQLPDERRKPSVEDLPWQPAGAPTMQYRRDDDMPTGQYDAIKPAGRANKYNTRITDLLTSIKDPEKKDESLHRLMQANKGYLVMVRFRPSDLADVITAVQESVSTLTAHDGYCIGFSEPRLMHIVLPSHQSMASDRWWDARDDRQSKHAVACFWFKDYIHARDWFQTGSVRFKQPEFPNNSPYQVVAIPLTYGRNKDPMPFTPDKEEITLLWSEYPSIFERYEHDFFDHYSRPENHIMRRYGGNPYVSACKYKAGDITPLNKFGSPGYARFEVPVERVARSWRGSWIAPDTVITVSTFPSMRDVSEFFYDPDYSEIRKNLSRYTEPVIVAITLKKVQGTSRR